MLEIERDYLVKKLPKGLSKYRFEKIRQGYLSMAPSPLRIRQKRKKFELTKKISVGTGFTTHEEVTLYLKSEEFRKLWPLTKQFNLEKTRYFIPVSG